MVRKRTFKAWVHVNAGLVLFNWQTVAKAKELRRYGYERATITLTPPPPKRKK